MTRSDPPHPPGPRRFHLADRVCAEGDETGASGRPSAPVLHPNAPMLPPAVPAARFAGPAAEWRRLSPSALVSVAMRPLSRWRHRWADGRVAARFAKTPRAAPPGTGRVCIIGRFAAGNGLSRAALYERDRLKSLYPTAAVLEVERDAPDSLAAYAEAHRGDPPDLVIVLIQPNLVWKHLRGLPPGFLAGSYRIGLAVWELPYFPPGWHHIDRFFHEYWTPTHFSAEALRLGTDLPVSVVPHPVRMPPLPLAARAPVLPFRGLSIMDLSTCPDRKNPWAHVEAWQKAFGDNPGAVLTMKLRFSRRTRRVARELEAMIGGARNIELIERELTDQEVLQLQGNADVCLSLHRAEGFGLTICEMLELGKAAVATDWSGNVAFMHRYPQAHPVRFRLVPYRDYLHRYPGYRGHWAEADTDHAARILRGLALRHVEARAPEPVGAADPAQRLAS